MPKLMVSMDPQDWDKQKTSFGFQSRAPSFLLFLPLTQEGTCSWFCLFGFLAWFGLFVLLAASYIKKDSENKLNRRIYREM